MAHREYLLDIMPGIKSVERQRRARIIEPLKELMPGNRVEIVQVERASEYDQTHDTAAKRAEHPMEVKKGKSFGGQAGAKKAAATRASTSEVGRGIGAEAGRACARASRHSRSLAQARYRGDQGRSRRC